MTVNTQSPLQTGVKLLPFTLVAAIGYQKDREEDRKAKLAAAEHANNSDNQVSDQPQPVQDTKEKDEKHFPVF